MRISLAMPREIYQQRYLFGRPMGKHALNTIAANDILLSTFLQHDRHDVRCKPRIVQFCLQTEPIGLHEIESNDM